jgi:hypothetical protein
MGRASGRTYAGVILALDPLRSLLRDCPARLARAGTVAQEIAPEPGTVYTSTPWSKVSSTISRLPSPSRSATEGAAGTPMPLPPPVPWLSSVMS